MSTSIDECRAYPCPNCGADVNPMTDVCRECDWKVNHDCEEDGDE